MGVEHDSRDDFFLPDFCGGRMVLGVVLISQLVAFVLTLARPPGQGFFTELAQISMFVQWLGLSGAAVLCFSRPWLARKTVPLAAALAFTLLLVNTGLLSELTFWLGQRFQNRGLTQTLFPQDHWPFLARNLGISAIVSALVLRYFFVTQAWRRNVQAEARARIRALQARIRPHFLFNSLNTIASLTRSDPRQAEEAVEDLADLFRATLKDADSHLRVKEELELSRIYQRIEQLRLGDRLSVDWQVADLPMRALVPGLTLQPLLENAIYHGIEPAHSGGTVTVRGGRNDNQLWIEVSNPVPDEGDHDQHQGNRLALANIRERFALAFGPEGGVQVEQTAGQFQVTLRFPFRE
jgi:two-component system sensor histidine kinase AlgZ